ncbi:MAG: class I SAM-dependent methyltransferase [Alphaproteobacteria bacterium]|nr:class I SAM-dependent methyltransferase [Alphaproteobacteria bacterium]
MTNIDNNYRERSECPICGADATGSRREIAASSPRAEELPPQQLGRFLSDYDASRIFFTYKECSSCGGCFCPQYFSENQLADLYADQPENMELAPLEARTRTQASYFDTLSRNTQVNGRFLEIGADIGIFAEQCAQKGNFESFILYEPNHSTHDAIAERMRGHSVEIRSGRFSAADVQPGSISIAAMIHVLDHILDPAQLLSEVRDSLQPGGALFLVTHNRASLLARTLGRRWPPYTMQHPHLFTPETMRTLLLRSGFERVSTHRTWNSFPATYFLHAGLATIGLERIPFPTFSRPLISLPLGNFATIAHRAKT